MAMNVGTGGGGGEPDVMIDINTTPLIDVMLVLIIMLIITIPIQLHSVNLNMPVGNPPPPTKEPVVVTIDIDFDGTVLWNGEALPDRAALENKLAQAAAVADQPEVHVRPQPGASYDSFATVMTAVHAAGLSKLGVTGREQFLDDQ